MNKRFTVVCKSFALAIFKIVVCIIRHLYVDRHSTQSFSNLLISLFPDGKIRLQASCQIGNYTIDATVNITLGRLAMVAKSKGTFAFHPSTNLLRRFYRVRSAN
jgi:hypothetical protein